MVEVGKDLWTSYIPTSPPIHPNIERAFEKNGQKEYHQIMSTGHYFPKKSNENLIQNK